MNELNVERPDEKATVALFAEQMTGQLINHRSKGDWHQLTVPQVLSKIREQVHEAEQAYNDMTHGKASEELVLRKCVNGANYFMILADHIGALQP